MNLLDVGTLRRVSGPMGSNPAGVFEDAHGARFYIKTLESAAQARNELIAAALYQLAGVPTLRYLRTTHPNQVATEFVQLDKRNVAQLSAAERKQAQRWFGVHAWTANWDAAGFLGDNQGVVSGTVLTLDLGGALEFRGMGDLKGKAFGTQVSELETLRRDLDNPFAVKLFGDMREADVQAAAAEVAQISDARIGEAISGLGGSDRLADKLVARKADMVGRLAEGVVSAV